jgi:hypothetical protein
MANGLTPKLERGNTMAHHIDAKGQLTVSIALGGRLLLTPRINHLTTPEGASNGRRDLRALRSRAMVELAMAWADPAWRRRGRAASE